MKRSYKYQTSELDEDQFEPGSNRKVLKNLLGIKKKRTMDQCEIEYLLRSLEAISKLFKQQHRFNTQDICTIHKLWLGRIYPWAGKYRQVNISKGGFSFAAAKHIPVLMEEFEKNTLWEFTPCCYKSLDKITNALAVVHTELVLIHPFREGNGRLARLIAILMAWQAELPTLDFGGIIGSKKQEYFAAVRAGMSRDYTLMKNVFDSIVKRTMQNADKR